MILINNNDAINNYLINSEEVVIGNAKEVKKVEKVSEEPKKVVTRKKIKPIKKTVKPTNKKKTK